MILKVLSFSSLLNMGQEGKRMLVLGILLASGQLGCGRIVSVEGRSCLEENSTGVFQHDCFLSLCFN